MVTGTRVNHITSRECVLGHRSRKIPQWCGRGFQRKNMRSWSVGKRRWRCGCVVLCVRR